MTTAIEFREDGHKYFVGGREIISVTQALDEGGYDSWKRYVDQMDLAHAQQVGTAVHTAIELYEEGTLDPRSLDPPVAGRLLAYQRWQNDFNVWGGEREQRVYNSIYQYAGRLDWRGLVRDREAIVDFKSGLTSHVVAFQLAAYAGCMAIPGEYARYSLQLREDGSYRLHEYPRADFREDWNAFLAALTTAKTKRKWGIK